MASAYVPKSVQARVASNDFLKISDDPSDCFYKCLISASCKPLNGKKLSNLVAHVKTHKEYFRKTYGFAQVELKTMPMIRLEFIQHCTELVTTNSEPFALLNKSGFLKLNRNKLQMLLDTGYGSGLAAPDCTAVKEHIKYLSAEILIQIGKEADGKFVSLMVDGASKYQRSILGVYLQFMTDFRIVTREIGMIDLTVRHTGEYLASVIRERLARLGIKTSQLVAVTTDNATNMTSMIECLNKAFGEDEDTIDNDETNRNASNGDRQEKFPQFIFSDANDYDAMLKNYLADMEIEELCTDNSLDVETQANLDSILQEINSIIGSQSLNIHGIRCVIHTVQLGVIKALGVDEFKAIIQLARGVCKELRKNTSRVELLTQGILLKTPHIDVKTRWNSTYVMVCTCFHF